MDSLAERKLLEAEFHDRLRNPKLRETPELYEHLTSNYKWYAVVRKSKDFVYRFLRQASPGARALDFGTGEGEFAIVMAEAGAQVTGIDISPTSVKNAAGEALRRGLRADFQVMDCERLEFPDSTFDLVSVQGVLHHLNLDNAYRELARTLKPTGRILCVEALAHNPLIHAYRKFTPHLRTAYEAEHILLRRDIRGASQYFNKVELRFFHFFTLLATPLRNTRLFGPVLSVLEAMDAVLLRIPGVRWQAWQVAFILSEPKK